ncbi:hypothetical protein MTO96_028855 [Rhipicephalus appendiculatus]
MTATEHLNNYSRGKIQAKHTGRLDALSTGKHQQIAPHLLLQMQSYRQAKAHRMKCCTLPSLERKMPLAEQGGPKTASAQGIQVHQKHERCRAPFGLFSVAV